ncbi:hypothetical protein AB6A40_007396 [Gnathostoma spinigerum]|uniref:Uncharacterized protein n=1 Tax=Gnathostoma spinigerum TaxID=75299 RepID=A0ABD6EVH9_9BILA
MVVFSLLAMVLFKASTAAGVSCFEEYTECLKAVQDGAIQLDSIKTQNVDKYCSDMKTVVIPCLAKSVRGITIYSSVTHSIAFACSVHCLFSLLFSTLSLKN